MFKKIFVFCIVAVLTAGLFTTTVMADPVHPPVGHHNNAKPNIPKQEAAAKP